MAALLPWTCSQPRWEGPLPHARTLAGARALVSGLCRGRGPCLLEGRACCSAVARPGPGAPWSVGQQVPFLPLTSRAACAVGGPPSSAPPITAGYYGIDTAVLSDFLSLSDKGQRSACPGRAPSRWCPETRAGRVLRCHQPPTLFPALPSPEIGEPAAVGSECLAMPGNREQQGTVAGPVDPQHSLG